MRALRLFLGLAFLGLAGCVGLPEFRLPEEFKGRKQREDPPLTGSLPERPGPGGRA